MTKSSVSGVRSTRLRRKTDSNHIGIWIIGVASAIVLVVVLIVALSDRPASVTVAAPDLPAEWLVGTTMGNPEAPVTVQAWEDFLCPHCLNWTNEIEPLLIEEYIKPGKVKLEFRQLPLSIHAPGADMAAMASLCASDQNAFWPYHYRLFPAQDQGQAGYTIDALERYATELGLDGNALVDCISSQKHRSVITADNAEAMQLGLQATPSILVQGTPVNSPFDFDEIKAAIENALATSGS